MIKIIREALAFLVLLHEKFAKADLLKLVPCARSHLEKELDEQMD